MTVSTPKVSVILPVYNGEAHLAVCIESILDQTFKDFEFVIVDDASTDNSPELLRKYSKIDKRVKVITHSINQKQTAAANTAIKDAKGTLLARMDADDIALPNRLLIQVEFMGKNQDIGLVGSWVDIIDDNGKVLKVWKTLTTDGVLGWDLLFGTSFAHSSVMMRSAIVKEVGLYQSPEAEDYDLWSRISRKTKVANIPQVLQQKRVWSGQLALKVPIETRDCVLQIMQKNINYLLNPAKLDIEMVRNIRKVSDKDKIIRESTMINEVFNILIQLYKNYLSTTSLTRLEKKNISVDLSQKLITLNTWQFNINYIRAILEKFYIAFHFPKLFLYNLIHYNRQSKS